MSKLPPMVVISEAVDTLPGAVTMAGMLTKHDSREFQRHMRVLGQYAVVLILAGSGTFSQAGSSPREVSAGDVLVLFPEIPHAYGPPEGGHWSELYLVFTGPVFDLWRSRGWLEPQHSVRSARPINVWLPRFLEVVPALCPAQPSDALEATCRLLTLLSQLHAQLLGAPGLVKPPWLDSASRALELVPGPSVREIANMVGLSYDSFRKRFAAATGYAPVRYRLVRRVERACYLIREGQLPLKEIATRLGFADEFHFSKRFKDITGISPGTFRSRAGLNPPLPGA